MDCSREQDVSSGGAGLLGHHLGEPESALSVRGARSNPEIGMSSVCCQITKSRGAVGNICEEVRTC